MDNFWKCVCECLSNVWIWIDNNKDILELILSFLSFAVASVLTVIIIRQTDKLSKKQQEQELQLNERQEELQKRQIRLDTFDYKNEIYHALYKVFQLTGEIETLFGQIELNGKSMEQLYVIFDIYREQLKIDVSDTMWLFRQAQYILPDNIYTSVSGIADHFNELTGDIGKLKLYPKLLTQEEMEKEKKKLLEDILDRCDKINDHVIFIEATMPAELWIRNVDK